MKTTTVGVVQVFSPVQRPDIEAILWLHREVATSFPAPGFSYVIGQDARQIWPFIDASKPDSINQDAITPSQYGCLAEKPATHPESYCPGK